MAYSGFLIFHILMGTTGLFSGIGAMMIKKGTKNHYTVGNVFFVSMLLMASSGVYIAASRSISLSVMGGLFTFYLVASSWMTVWRKKKEIGFPEMAITLFAFGIGLLGYSFGLEANASTTGLKDGEAAAPYFVFGTFAILGGISDIRMMIKGGYTGTQRLVRHLWRMCIALLIAAISIFLGNTQVFSEEILQSQVLFVPVILILASTLYWLFRVKLSKRFKWKAI